MKFLTMLLYKMCLVLIITVPKRIRIQAKGKRGINLMLAQGSLFSWHLTGNLYRHFITTKEILSNTFVRITLGSDKVIDWLLAAFYGLTCHYGIKWYGLIESGDSQLTAGMCYNFLVNWILFCSMCPSFTLPGSLAFLFLPFFSSHAVIWWELGREVRFNSSKKLWRSHKEKACHT